MQIAIYLLIAFLIAIAAFAAVIWLKIHKLKKTYPEEAQEKNLRARYHQLLDKLNEAVDSGDTELSMLNALQAINYPAETLFVSWVKKHHSAEDGIFILDRRPSHKIASGIRYRSVCNGGGHGLYNDQHFLILQFKTEYYRDSCIELWFKTESPIEGELALA